MKKKLIFLPILSALALAGCSLEDILSSFSNTPTQENSNQIKVDENLETTETGEAEHAGDDYDFNEQIIVENPEEITVTETEEEL